MKCNICNNKIIRDNFCEQCGAPAPEEKENSVLGLLALIFSASYILGLAGLVLGIIDLAIKSGKKKNLSVIALSIFGFYMLVSSAILVASLLGFGFV